MKKSVKIWTALVVAGCMVGMMLVGCETKGWETATRAGTNNTVGVVTSDVSAPGDVVATSDEVTLRCSW